MSGYWDKTIAALPPIKDDPFAAENAEIVRGWLEALREGRHTEAQFDAQIQGYHIFQYTAIYGPRDEYWPDLAKQIDRRQYERGLRYCVWRGWTPIGIFDEWRGDRARERAAAPGKFHRAA